MAVPVGPFKATRAENEFGFRPRLQPLVRHRAARIGPGRRRGRGPRQQSEQRRHSILGMNACGPLAAQQRHLRAQRGPKRSVAISSAGGVLNFKCLVFD